MRGSVCLLTALLMLPAVALRAETSSEPSPRAVLAELPFVDFHERNRIVVDLAPEGHRPFPLILDTGATHSVVTPLMARSLGVSVRRVKSDPYRQATRLGRDLLFYVDASLTDTGSKTGFEYGLLGGNFLAEYVVELDFERRRVRLLDPGRYSVPDEPEAPDEVTLPLLRVANRPAVEVEVAGARFPVMLDTGSPDGLIVDAKLAASSEVVRRPELPCRFGTVWGEVAAEWGEAASLSIGPFSFGPVPVVVLPNGWFNFGLPKDAVIGFDLLSQFTVRIDYPRERLWLRRRPDARVLWQGEPWNGWPEASGRAVIDPEALVPARPAEPAPEPEVWLEVGTPAEGERREGRVAWVEIQGWAGAGTPMRHDVVVLVDYSGSTALASGIDVDGDGRIGKKSRRTERWRTYNPNRLSSDRGDTVLAAELVAIRRLVELLDPLRTRVGIIAFATGAHIVATVGSHGPGLEHALEELADYFGWGATNLSAALDLARHALIAAGGKGRQKSILILSDGYPTAPGTAEQAAEECLKRAAEAAASGLRIHSFGLGLDKIEEGDVYVAIATRTDGRYVRLEQPGAIVHELSRIDLARVASVEIENRTAEEPGRAVRVFPDGSFDGFVKLSPGENVIRVTARGEGGRERSVDRRMFFEKREPRSPAEAQAFEREAQNLKAALAQRSMEIELAAEARQGARRNSHQDRVVEIYAEEDAGDPPEKR